MSGIGLNLREVPEDNGGVKLKVLGLLLDGPAHSAGVRQVATRPKLVNYRCNILIFVLVCAFHCISTLEFTNDSWS